VGGHRSHGVDALRGLAVLAVFAYHALLVADLGASAWLSALYGGRFSWFFPHQLGRLGVQLFFVVSGCCIHSAMRAWAQAHPGAPAAVQWRCYALRRFWRLGPLYAATLVLTFLALHPAPATPAGATDLLVHAALLQARAHQPHQPVAVEPGGRGAAVCAVPAGVAGAAAAAWPACVARGPDRRVAVHGPGLPGLGRAGAAADTR